MNKVRKIKEQLLQLEQQKMDAEQIIIEAKKEIDEQKKEMSYLYQEFFDKKNKKEFVFYDRFPSLELFGLHIDRVSKLFPLYENGVLNVNELAELIKHFYQFQNGSQYEILTMGATETDGAPVYGGQVFSAIPHIYFIIGNDKTLNPYKEFNGHFINDDKLYNSIYLYTRRKKDLIVIELESGYSTEYNMECLTGNYSDRRNAINYYDYHNKNYNYYNVLANKNVFNYNVQNYVRNKGLYGYNGIKDVMNFNSHIFDTFISKMLISVVIYKRNNNIEELSSEDYNHIFDVLFNEKVDIKNEVKKDISKQLIYVPNSKYQR